MSFHRNEFVGLTTKEALLQLKSEIEEIIDSIEAISSKLSFLVRIRRSLLHHRCKKSIYHWTDFLFGCIAVLFLLIGYLSNDEHLSNLGLLIETLIIGLLVFGNAFITLREDILKKGEMIQFLQSILEELQEVAIESPWYPYNYLKLNCPIAASVTLQWTFRDGELVNLPYTLLVKGDLILLRPGQTVPVRCKCAEENSDSASTYESNDLFLPDLDTEDTSLPKQHPALQPRLYCAEETVFTPKVQKILTAGEDRPSSLLHNEIYMIKTKIIYPLLLPITVTVVLIANMCRYFYWPESSRHWSELLILPIQAVLPALTILFPPIYYILNWFGIARLHLQYKQSMARRKIEEQCISDNSDDDVEDWHVDLKCCDVVIVMKKIARGQSDAPCRTVDLVHVLGSVTAICCLDKKGILSWPVPTIEKVFLLNTKTQTRTDPNQILTSIREVESDDDLCLPVEFNHDAQVEVLDVSHEPGDPHSIVFDDPSWRRHIESLKPLGLNILLNTCNIALADACTQFADHVTVATHGKSDSVAVVNHRCLCELPRQIGFAGQALDSFEHQFDICMYKNVDDRSKVFQKSVIKHKTPMPNMMSVVVREKNTATQQLMTQGTADIMLDLCSDYWNGKDLVPLLDMDRKRILDFYHRQSMTAYCLALAYSPVIDKLSPKLRNSYIQLPTGSFHTCPDINSPTTTMKSFDLDSIESKTRKAFDRRHSADSAMNGGSESVVSDLDACVKSQCNQIFIGMVTTQYPVMIDVVQLIEQLEHACIRFVYFSKENELRSRVFSEKLGLESGWNCHISLLSEHASDLSNISLNSSHQELQKRGSCKRTVSNTSSRHCSSHSLSRDFSPRKSTTIDEDDIRTELLAPKSSKSPNEETDVSEVRISDDSRFGSGERHQNAGVHRSPSIVSSHSTDSMVIDSQNRAKLPKGIDNIRPHLENVDNVPLLVSLFTDCTPEATHEMIKIMQENGEVVCVVGSTANWNNIDTFLQADACVGMEPLYPHVCVRQPPVLDLTEAEYPSPMALGNKLTSLPCSLSFHRQASFDLRSSILEARAHTLLTRNCLQFYLCCSLATSLVQVIASVFLLPPIFSTRQVIWLVFVVLPILSVSLVWHSKPDGRLSTMATGKNGPLKWPVVLEFVLYASARFVPSVAVCVLCFGLNLYSTCRQIAQSSCHLWFANATGEREWTGWYDQHLRLSFAVAQHFTLVQIVLYLVAISLGFVHRSRQLWQRQPFDNRGWLMAVSALCLLQAIFTSVDLTVVAFWYGNGATATLVNIPPLASWLLALIWLLALPLVGELIKLREIRGSVRYQKRAKLDFGTKLGMNSPF